MKKSFLLSASLIGALVVGISYSSASDFFGEFVGNLKKGNATEGIFETINSHPIPKKEFEHYASNAILIAKLNKQEIPTQEKLKQEFNKNEVLYLEAVKQNLAINDQQALDYAKDMRTKLDDPNVQYAKEMKNLISKEIEGLQITEDQYWNEAAPKLYKKGLSIGQLREKFTNEFSSKHPKAKSDEVNAAWDQYTEQLLKQADIK